MDHYGEEVKEHDDDDGGGGGDDDDGGGGGDDDDYVGYDEDEGMTGSSKVC